ncbi:MAG: hypothetical protein N2112_04075 [Gemmataceae bacterium]|jgi:hypothetical protein|nr:hypothetical protein [Gemmataceae bacterium]
MPFSNKRRSWLSALSRRYKIPTLLLLLIFGVGIHRWVSEPNYEFPLESIDDPEQIQQILSLASDLRNIRYTQPFYFQDPTLGREDQKYDPTKPSIESLKSIQMLANWILKCDLPIDPNDPKKFQIAKGSDARDYFARRSSEPNFQLINGMVQLLPPLNELKLRSWRKMSVEELTQELADHFRQLRIKERDEGYIKLLTTPASEALLRRLEFPEFPKRESWYSGRFRRGGIRSSESDRELWVEQFLAKTDKHIQPNMKFYQAVLANERFAFGNLDQNRIVYRAVLQNGKIPLRLVKGKPVTYVNVLVAVSSGANESNNLAEREWDTGISLHEVNWQVVGKSSALGYPENPADLMPIWPISLSDVSLDLQKLHQSLTEFGFPKEVELVQGQITLGDPQTPSFQIDCICQHPTFTGFQHPIQLKIQIGDKNHFTQQATKIAREVRSQLAQYIPTVTRLNGWSVQFTTQEGSIGKFIAQFDLPAIGFPIQVDAYLLKSGQLTFHSTPTVESQNFLIEKLLIPEMTKNKMHWIDPALPPVMEKIEINPTHNTVNLSWIRSDNNPQNPNACTRYTLPIDELGQRPWIVESTSKPMDFIDCPALEPQESRPPATPIAECQTRIQNYLSKEYGSLPVAPRVSFFSSSAGLWVSVGLKIYDYPEFTVGPRLLSGDMSPEEFARDLMSTPSLKKASRSGWAKRRDWTHPRFGRVRPEIKEIDISGSKISILCKPISFEIDNAPSHLDEIYFENRQWLRPRWAKQPKTSKEFFTQLALSELKRYNELFNLFRCGLATLSIDEESLQPGESLSFQPPLIPFKLTLILPLSGLQIDMRGIRYDQDGLHFPDKLRFSYLGSIYFPQICLSDPVIQLDFLKERPGLSIAGKFTPPISGVNIKGGKRPAPINSQLNANGSLGPIPELRLDNPWLHAIFLQLEFSIHLDVLEQDLELQTQGRLRALKKIDVAQVRLACRPKQLYFEGEAEALGRIPGFDRIPARLSGNVELDGKSGKFQMHADAELFGVNCLHLLIQNDFRNGNHPDNYRLVGHRKFPLHGTTLTLEGVSSTDFKRYELTGEIHSGPIQIRVTIDETHGVRWTPSVEWEGRVFAWTISEAIFGSGAIERIQSQLDTVQMKKSFFSENYQIPVASIHEEELVRALVVAKDRSPVKPQKQSEVHPTVGSGHGFRGYIEYTGLAAFVHPDRPSIVSIKKLKQENLTQRTIENAIERDLVDIDYSPIAHVYSPGTGSHSVVVKKSPSREEVMYVAFHSLHHGKMFLWLPNEGVRGNFYDISDHYAPSVLKNPLTTAKDTLLGWHSLSQAIFHHAWAIYLAKFAPPTGQTSEFPSRLSMAVDQNATDTSFAKCGYEYNLTATYLPPDQKHTRYFWPCSLRFSEFETVLKAHVDIVHPYIPADLVNPNLYARIQQAFSQPELARETSRHPTELIGLSNDGNTMVWLSVQDRSQGEFNLWSGNRQTRRMIKICIAENNGKFPQPFDVVSQERIYHGANLVARSLFSGKPVLSEAEKIFVGQQGVIIVVKNSKNSGDWWLIRDLGKNKEPECVFVARTSFDEWNSETKVYLTPEWREATKRKELSNETIAKMILSPFNRKGDHGFEANPFGLVMGLAKK